MKASAILNRSFIFWPVFLLVCQFAQAAQIPSLNWVPRSDWLNVQSMGAVADGMADDSVAIQSVLDSAVDGTVIYFPPGIYRVTQELHLKGPLLGVALIGHGRDTTLLWDGVEEGNLFTDNGVAYARFVGITFEGQDRASVGFHHFSTIRFETEVRHQHLAFRGFTRAALLAAPEDNYALAEASFENCLFETSKLGVAFVSFNDYNYTFDGCEFNQCKVGIKCRRGNFYARNTHFENSTIADIESNPEHGCSVRRCTSKNSHRFIDSGNSVSPLTVQDCAVDSWQATDGAIRHSNAPLTLFDCAFSNPPNSNPPIVLPSQYQKAFFSENAAAGSSAVYQTHPDAVIFNVAAGHRRGVIQSADQQFLKNTVTIPNQVFDAKVDFGAVGDGATDDTAAIQNCIHAASSQGNGAIAYIPTGKYNIHQTLIVTGANYYIGGTGFKTELRWKGAAGGTTLKIENPDHIVLEHIAIGHHDGGLSNNAIDILQTKTGNAATYMTYDGVFVYGLYQKQPFRQGLHLEGLDWNDIVHIRYSQGNLNIKDSARATILANQTYEGAVVVEGDHPDRDGFLGFLTRLSTINDHSFYLRDNQNLIMSDFYIEQADNGFVFEGDGAAPAGRATLQLHKFHLNSQTNSDAITIDNYQGQIFLGSQQFYVHPDVMRLNHTGVQLTELFIYSSLFYITELAVNASAALNLRMLGNSRIDNPDYNLVDIDSAGVLTHLPTALDDLRRLGIADWVINHAGLSADSDGDGQTDFSELRSDTHPFDANSCFCVDNLDIMSTPSTGLTLEWDNEVGLSYEVLSSNKLNGPYEVISGNISFTGSTASYADSNPLERYRFYRVRKLL